MESYAITVWYRYSYHGEQEKDFDIHNIESTSAQKAVNKSSDFYRTLSCIPYQFICDGIVYIPERLAKNDIFNLKTL